MILYITILGRLRFGVTSVVVVVEGEVVLVGKLGQLPFVVSVSAVSIGPWIVDECG